MSDDLRAYFAGIAATYAFVLGICAIITTIFATVSICQDLAR